MSIAYVCTKNHINLFIKFFPQSPDGKLIASGAIDGIINLFDLQSGRLLHTLEGIYTQTHLLIVILH